MSKPQSCACQELAGLTRLERVKAQGSDNSSLTGSLIMVSAEGKSRENQPIKQSSMSPFKLMRWYENLALPCPIGITWIGLLWLDMCRRRTILLE